MIDLDFAICIMKICMAVPDETGLQPSDSMQVRNFILTRAVPQIAYWSRLYTSLTTVSFR